MRKYLSNTQDIVVFRAGHLEFGLTKDFPEEAYAELEALLVEAFGEWWVKPDEGDGWNMKLEDIWSQPGLNEGEGRILISYEVSVDWDFDLGVPSCCPTPTGPNSQPLWHRPKQPNEIKNLATEY